MIVTAKATISIVFSDEAEVKAAIAALKGEEAFKKRSTSHTIQNGKELIITVDSQDSVSLRAALNAYLRDLQVIEGVKNDIE